MKDRQASQYTDEVAARDHKVWCSLCTNDHYNLEMFDIGA